MTQRSLAVPGGPVALVLAVLLAACGGTAGAPSAEDAGASDAGSAAASQPAPSTEMDAPAPSVGTDVIGSIDACELLPDEEIAELTTWTPELERSGPQLGVFPDGCYWELAGGTSAEMGVPASITLGVRAEGGRAYFDTYFEPYAEENGEEPLDGVGDVGLIGELAGTVMAVQGDVLVSVQWIDFGGDETSMAIALLERALANLDR